jgi:hypothetical protein
MRNQSKTFLVFFGDTNGGFKKGDVCTTSEGITSLVVRVYRNTRFRRILKKLGFKIRLNGVKMKLTKQ